MRWQWSQFLFLQTHSIQTSSQIPLCQPSVKTLAYKKKSLFALDQVLLPSHLLLDLYILTRVIETSHRMLGFDREFGSGVWPGTWPRIRRADSESQVEGQDFYLLSRSERMEEKQQQQTLDQHHSRSLPSGTTKRDVKAPTNTFPTPPSLFVFFFIPFLAVFWNHIQSNLSLILRPDKP